jgi:hypothetical protein
MESFDHERTSALKLGPDLDEAVEAAYSRCFNLRIEIPADALQLELPKGDIMSILDDQRLIDEVRFDKRKKSWVSEKSTYQHLLRRTMELCLVTKPHRRRNAIRIFISEAVSTRYGTVDASCQGALTRASGIWNLVFSIDSPWLEWRYGQTASESSLGLGFHLLFYAQPMPAQISSTQE